MNNLAALSPNTIPMVWENNGVRTLYGATISAGTGIAITTTQTPSGQIQDVELSVAQTNNVIQSFPTIPSGS